MRQSAFLVLMLLFAITSSEATSLDKIGLRNGIMSSTSGLLQPVQQECCPAGYPWLRNSTNTCYSSEADCRDTNGGGWSCRQVNSC
jgi:hypothetical protein